MGLSGPKLCSLGIVLITLHGFLGTYEVDGRKADGVRWAEYEARGVKFVESVLIADLNRLWCQSPSWEI